MDERASPLDSGDVLFIYEIRHHTPDGAYGDAVVDGELSFGWQGCVGVPFTASDAVAHVLADP